MTLSRVELADATTPERLVLEILKHESLAIPVPIDDLCQKLDIAHIRPLETEGFEGGLITDVDKHSSAILYNQGSPIRRRRFTIAHELGHFLMRSHVPNKDGMFLCSQDDFLKLSKEETDRRYRMEYEANRFASGVLLPAPHFRKDVAATAEPSLNQILAIAQKYQVSLEVAARSYILFRDEPCAFVLCHERKVLRYSKHPNFPFISVRFGDPVPGPSVLFRRPYQPGVISEVEETDAGVWLDIQRGESAPSLYEQVYIQRNGYAAILIFLELPEDKDLEDNLTSRERYRRRMARGS